MELLESLIVELDKTMKTTKLISSGGDMNFAKWLRLGVFNVIFLGWEILQSFI